MRGKSFHLGGARLAGQVSIFELRRALLPLGENPPSCKSHQHTEINAPAEGARGGYLCAQRRGTVRVTKARANEVVNLAIGFEKLINPGARSRRRAESRGHQLLPLLRRARLPALGRPAAAPSDSGNGSMSNLPPLLCLTPEYSIVRGNCSWVVFEPNGELLWGNVLPDD